MDYINEIKALIPNYAKDVRINLDGVLGRSSLPANEAAAVALAAAYAAQASRLVAIIRNTDAASDVEKNAALSAAALMAMNNVWYPYVEMTGDAELKALPAQLRMQAYATHAGVDKRLFELYALAASIIGKCHFCVQSHYGLLKQSGMTTEQLRDVGRIAAVIAAAANAIAVEEAATV
ncbi:MAG TPA: carboxymuconolactone decarboxylase family protein [Burkholderiaceae bacterium]|jgi:alkyl hydroperoxide reductase subunit D|nr:carboxymuconolactone decarboxylase family protein [Burkholderiaceae bacterium]